MSTYEFFTSCLEHSLRKYQELVNTPRARAGRLIDEKKELVNKVQTALDYGEITEEQAKYLSEKFKKIDFSNLARVRAANKEREKYNVGFKFSH